MRRNNLKQQLMNPQKRIHYNYFDLLMAAFVAILLISNLASTKIVSVWKFDFDGGTILFPLSYIFGDILTEVYGYQRSRKVIWMGFFSAFLMALVLWIVQELPAAQGWEYQSDYQHILGFIPRIVIGSLVAFWTGEFTNSFIMSKLKILTKGKFLWVRTIGSTLAGEGVDTAIFCLIAFYGALPNSLLITIIISNYIFKCGAEILMTPVTYKVVYWLKKHEQEDYYDYGISYNPFKWN